MFLDRFIPKKYLAKSEVCALEIVVGDNGNVFHFTVLKNKGKKLEISYAGTTTEKIELPKHVLKSKMPLVVIINGKGVVIKKVNLPQEEELEAQQIIEQNLPAVNKDDLFIQVFRQDDRTAFISLCRKEIVRELLSELKKQKYDVADVHIGAPAVLGLKPLWDSFNRISTTTHTMELNNGNVETILPSAQKEKVNVQGLEIESEHMLGFATGLGYVMQVRVNENCDAELAAMFKAHLDKNKFRILTLACVAIAFVIALVNVLFYTSYFDKNSKLESELLVYEGKSDELNKLLNDYQSNKDLIEGAGILNGNKLSEYADRIGVTIPTEVVLGQLYFNPKKEDVESDDSLVVFSNHQLIIKGNCNKSLVVNDWLNVLKMQAFVKAVTLEKFTYSKEGSLPNFEIKIITK